MSQILLRNDIGAGGNCATTHTFIWIQNYTGFVKKKKDGAQISCFLKSYLNPLDSSHSLTMAPARENLSLQLRYGTNADSLTSKFRAHL
jgi:hypothetical protein